MKILICTQEYPPSGSGIANVVKAVEQELMQLGHKCTILSTNQGDIKLGCSRIIKKFAGLGLLIFWNKVRKYIIKNEHKYDLIWVHNPLFLNKVKSEKIRSTVHTTYVSYHKIYRKLNYSLFVKLYYKIMKSLEKKCYKSNIFPTTTVSPEVSKELRELNVPSNNISYIANGVNTNKFLPEGKSWLPIQTKKKVITCVGRANYQKNTQAFVEIARLTPQYEFLWVGGGELLKAMQERTKNDKNIHFVGKQPFEKIPQILRGSDAYILLSFYEGQPLTLLEAMSSGTPCIVSNIPNMRQLIEESKCGISITPENTKLSSKKIINYVESDKFKSDSKRSREYSVKRLDWKIITKEYLKQWN